MDKATLTQVGRALRQLGINHIFADSPQARGSSERVFATLQGRLPKELELKGITTLEEANRYLQEVYSPFIISNLRLRLGKKNLPTSLG